MIQRTTKEELLYNQQCYQISLKYHQSSKKHQRIKIQQLKSKTMQLISSEGEQWIGNMEKMENKIDDLIDQLTQFRNSFSNRYFEHRIITTCYLDNEKQSDKQYFIQSTKKVEDQNFNKLTCFQVSKILNLSKTIASKPKLKLQDQFNKVQEKIGQDILQKFYRIFNNIPKNKANLINSQQIQKRIKDLLKQQLNNKQDRPIQKIQQEKPKIQQSNFKKQTKQPQRKVERQKVERQKIEQKRPFNRYTESSQDNFREKNYSKNIGNARVNRNQKNQIRENDHSKTYGHKRDNIKNQKSDHRIRDDQIKINQIEGAQKNFSIVLVVLQILEERLINGNMSQVCLIGDQTGITTAVFKKQSTVKIGKTILISKCRIYMFRQTLQIQDSKQSQVSQVKNYKIEKIGKYSLSSHAQKEYEKRKDQIQYQTNITRDINSSHQHKYQSNRRNQPAHNKNRQEQRPSRNFNRQKRQDKDDRQTFTNKRGGRNEPNRGNQNNRGNHVRRGNQNRQNKQYRKYDDQDDYKNYQSSLAAKRQQRRQQLNNATMNMNKRRVQTRNQGERRDRYQEDQRSVSRSLSYQSQAAKRPTSVPKNQNNVRNNQYQPRRRNQQNIPSKDSKINEQTPSGFTKISKIQPGQQRLSFIAQVIKVIRKTDRKIVVNIGDQTGIVNCELPLSYDDKITKGKVYQFLDFNSEVVSEYILMSRNSQKSSVRLSNKVINSISYKNDISAIQYVSDDEY